MVRAKYHAKLRAECYLTAAVRGEFVAAKLSGIGMPDDLREAIRQKALAEIVLLDTPPEREFDALAQMAQRMLGTSMAAITLIDADRQWFKARRGALAPQTPRGPALCAIVFETEAPMMVADASKEPRFAANPFVVSEPYIRFYVGVPIRARQTDGSAVTIGTLCVLDGTPREPTSTDLDVLTELACIAEALVEARAIALRAAATSEDWRIAVEGLKRERRQLKQAERMADMGSWRHDLEQQRTMWSDGVFAIHELPVDEGVPNGEIMNFFPEPDRSTFLDAVMRTLDTGKPFELDADFVTARGNARRVRCSCEIELSQGKPIALIGLIQDITGQHTMEQELRRLARTDDLTQLPNRAAFYQILETHLAEAQTTDKDLAVLLIDLDGFKGVNDVLGHAAGDEVLRRVANKLSSSYIQQTCFPARLGGDEFAVLVPATVSPPELDRIVGQLLRDLHVRVEGAGGAASVTGTIGIAWSRVGSYDRETILRCADVALYEAKRTRKGTAKIYREPLEPHLVS